MPPEQQWSFILPPVYKWKTRESSLDTSSTLSICCGPTKNDWAPPCAKNNEKNYPFLVPYLHIMSSPSMSLSTASEGRPIISNVFSHTSWEVSVLCASSEEFVGLQSWDKKAPTGHSSAFNSSQYSGTWGSVAAKRALLEPALEVNWNDLRPALFLYFLPGNRKVGKHSKAEELIFSPLQWSYHFLFQWKIYCVESERNHKLLFKFLISCLLSISILA